MEPVMQSILNSVNMLYVLVALWGLSQVFSSVAYTIPEGWPGDIAGEEMIASIQRFCGRDENGTVIHEPEDDFCEMPRYTTYPTSGGYGIGSVFHGRGSDYGPEGNGFLYFQVSPFEIGYSCDGVLLVDSMFKIRRPPPNWRSRPNIVADDVETLGAYGYGKYGYGPSSLGMRCLVKNLTDFGDSAGSVYGVRHGSIYGCTICDELAPFDCPTEFERWYLDSDLMYRDGNVCDEIYGDRNSTTWFAFIEYYYNPSISIYLAYTAEVAELGRNHPFMPGHFCSEDDCHCTLPPESPVYPDSLFGGANPTLSIPVTLSGYPYHSRKLGQSLSGFCNEAIAQAVFKLSADASWNDTNAIFEYGRLNRTEMLDLSEIRRKLLTPGIYINRNTSDWPLIPKMSGLMNARVFNFKDINNTVISNTLTRCLIKPDMRFLTEEEQYANGQPFNCVACIYDSPCVAPIPENGTTEWILDIITGFLQREFVPSITVPPGYELRLAAYNASDDTPVARSNLPIAERNSTEILQDDPNWSVFTYCRTIECTNPEYFE